MERLSIDKVIDLFVEENRIRQICNTNLIGKPIISEHDLAHEEVLELLKELKSYREAEEQGLILRLPCKIGDTAYCVHREYLKNADRWIKTIDEVKVDSFVINANVLVNVSFYIGCDIFRKTLTPYKTLFFTKEEAEQALERMVKENG